MRDDTDVFEEGDHFLPIGVPIGWAVIVISLVRDQSGILRCSRQGKGVTVWNDAVVLAVADVYRVGVCGYHVEILEWITNEEARCQIT